MSRKLFLKPLALMACLLCSMSAVSQHAYAVYDSSNTTLTFYCDNNQDSRQGTIYDLEASAYRPEWYYDDTNASVTRVVFDPSFENARPTTTYSWFDYMSNLQSITGMNYLNTSEVTNMSDMFFSCSGLTSIDVSGFNTDKVTSMTRMFYGCSELTSLDLRNFNTENVITMNGMFAACDNLASVDVSSFNTSNVVNMDGVFNYCVSLTDLDVSNFNTAKVTDMTGMFGNCRGLTRLDLTNFNTAQVTSMSYMFNYSDNLVAIFVGDNWSTDAVTWSRDMFRGCTSLVGRKGTEYDPDHIDASYAHLDGGVENPGYLSVRGLLGDVNDDGRIDISDVTALIHYVLSGDTTLINIHNADMNSDFNVNVTDVTALIHLVLNNGIPE